jgi:hypothetical protein
LSCLSISSCLLSGHGGWHFCGEVLSSGNDLTELYGLRHLMDVGGLFVLENL